MLQGLLPATIRRARCAACVAAVALFSVVPAAAQPVAPGAAPTSPVATELTPAERAKRDGDKVFHWILIHGDKPRKPLAAPKDDKPVASAAPVRAKPTARATAPADEPPLPASPPAAQTAAVPPATSRPAEPPAEPQLAIVVPTPAPAPAIPAVAVPVEEDLLEPLRPISQAEPKFPATLLRTLRAGQVRVKFSVLPDGSVADPTVVTTSNARLNPSALAAVAQWRFAPVRKAQRGLVDLGFDNAE